MAYHNRSFLTLYVHMWVVWGGSVHCSHSVIQCDGGCTISVQAHPDHHGMGREHSKSYSSPYKHLPGLGTCHFLLDFIDWEWSHVLFRL